MSTLVLKNGRVFDPSRKLDKVADVVIDIKAGTIANIARNANAPKDAEVIDCKGLVVCPGFLDIHVHFREPGFTSKESIATGAAAAVHGGFTTVVTMPNTDPPLDNSSSIAYQYLQADKAGKARVYPMGCVTKERKGEELAELGMLARAGAVGFTDDGAAVGSSFLMRSALEYASALGKVVVQHCEDHDLSNGAVIHEGKVSAALGINGYPSAAEEVIVARDIRLAKLAGARFHVQHISAKGSVALVREAKRRGVRVTAEVAPHHLLLTDDACRDFDAHYKMNPPLREASDIEACLQGLRDGTIDCLASDHAPHTSEEKSQEFIHAPNGVIGLETNIGVLLAKLVATKKLPLKRFVEAWTGAAAKVLDLPFAGLKPGAVADITILDLGLLWTVDPERFKSKARNCPFNGWKLKGAPVYTIVGGKVFEAIGRTMQAAAQPKKAKKQARAAKKR
ncbi:MAG: dihydroorotase [Planctomycetes bacterium]|nr:dihydroorotase [Planctomycetota bacterium]